MNSFNHYAYGAIGEWMYAYLMGLKVNEDFPGFKRYKVQPLFDKNFDFIKGSFDSNYGKIQIAWTRKKGKLQFSLYLPANTSSDVVLSKPMEGSWKLDNPKLDAKILSKQDDKEKTSLLLGSGKYNFSFIAN
jgi:alpha-L-rhamnosidase